MEEAVGLEEDDQGGRQRITRSKENKVDKGG